MVDIDMPTPSQPGTGGGKGAFGLGIPTPLLLIAVGGGIGLIVFLTKKAGTGGVGTGPNQSTLLPNTAIMLGSLQQGVLDLQGQVSTGNADLSSQLTGVGETLGTQIDSSSAATQQSFSDLSAYLGANFQNIQASETAISSAIAGVGTQNAGLADSLTQVLQGLQAMSGVQQNILGGVNQTLSDQNSQQLALNALGQQTAAQINTLSDNIGAEILAMDQGLGGSIGTTKGELLTLAYTLGKGQAVQQYLTSRGDYTVSGQTHEG